MKECKKCFKIKELIYFNKNKAKKDGIDIYCKECVIENGKKYRKVKEILIPLNPQDNKICIHCKEEKSKTNFNKRSRSDDGLDYLCKICSIKSKKNTKWYINQYEQNKDYKKKWEYEKYNNNINHKLKSNIRCRMNSLLKKSRINRNNSSLKYLGCSLEEYKIYLENQFKENMTWENHGVVWEVDHIIPLSLYDLSKEENIFKSFHYTNTQPLNKSENRSKKNKIS